MVDVEQHLFLPLGELWVGVHGVGDGTRWTFLEDSGLDVERLRGDPQPLGDLLQDLGRRLAQPPLHLAQVGVAHTRRLRELPQGHLRRLTLRPDVATDVVDRLTNGLADVLHRPFDLLGWFVGCR